MIDHFIHWLQNTKYADFILSAYGICAICFLLTTIMFYSTLKKTKKEFEDLKSIQNKEKTSNQ